MNLWKDLLIRLGSTEEFQAKVESLTADAFLQARKRMEACVETFNRTSSQTLDLFEKGYMSDLKVGPPILVAHEIYAKHTVLYYRVDHPLRGVGYRHARDRKLQPGTSLTLPLEKRRARAVIDEL